MKHLILGIILALFPVAALAAGPSQFTPAELDGTLHLATPATLADKQSSVFLSDSAGSLNVNIAGASVPSLPVTVTVTNPTFQPVGPDCTLTVTGATAISTTACSGGIPATANYALVCNIGSTVLYSQTAVPTTTTGQFLSGGTVAPPSIPVCTKFGPSPHSALTNLQWIEQTGSGSAELHFSFYLDQ